MANRGNTRSRAMLLGAITVWPIVYMVLLVGFMASFVFRAFTEGQLASVFHYLVFVHLVTILLVVGLLIFYVVHVRRNPQLTSDSRLIWTVVMVILAWAAAPVYWWLYIRPHPVSRNEADI